LGINTNVSMLSFSIYPQHWFKHLGVSTNLAYLDQNHDFNIQGILVLGTDFSCLIINGSFRIIPNDH